MSQFKKLTVDNNWEALTYKIGDAEVKKSKKVQVKFPDGSIVETKLQFKPYYTSYSDMGRRYEVTTKLAYIVIDIMGLKHELCFYTTPAKLKFKLGWEEAK